MKPKYRRMVLITIFAAILTTGLVLILEGFRKNIVFYYTPTEYIKEPNKKKLVRLGGVVKENSIKSEGEISTFVITDFEKEIEVRYRGILSPMFRDNQGTVVKGKIGDSGVFQAEDLLIKHDENYMPREVKDSLEKRGVILGK